MALFGNKESFNPCIIEDKNDLRNSIEEIIKGNIEIDDPFCGFDGADNAADKIIDLLENNFMVFFS